MGPKDLTYKEIIKIKNGFCVRVIGDHNIECSLKLQYKTKKKITLLLEILYAYNLRVFQIKPRRLFPSSFPIVGQEDPQVLRILPKCRKPDGQLQFSPFKIKLQI